MKVLLGIMILLVILGGFYLYLTAGKAATHPSLKKAKLPPLIPVSAFFADTSAQWGHRVSYDGTYIGYLGSEWGKVVVYIRTSDNADVLHKIKLNKIRDFYWDNRENLIRVFSENRLWEIDINTPGRKKQIDVTPRGFDNWSIIFSPVDKISDPENDTLVVASRDRNPEFVDLFTVRRDGGGKKLLIKNQGATVGWLLDRNGTPKIQMDRNEKQGTNIYLLYNSDEKQLIKSVDEADIFYFVRPYNPNQPLLAVSNIGRDKAVLVQVDIENGNETLVDAHKQVDIDRVWGFQTLGSNLDLVRYFDGYPTLNALSPRGEVAKNLIEKAGEHIDVNGLNSSADGRYLLAAVSADEKSYQHYLFDLEQQTTKTIYEHNFRKYQESLSNTKPVHFSAADGTKIPALLTLPAAIKPIKLPTIIDIHGGPASHRYWQYDHTIQFLANRGYAVLQVNFRGSTGYGKAFRALGYGNIGTTMQTDITDAVDWLVAQGIADENALAVVGGSYGGYSSALAMTRDADKSRGADKNRDANKSRGAGQNPNADLTSNAGLFAAGVVEYAVTDIIYQMDNNPYSWGLHLNEMKQYFGDHENTKDREIMLQRSPITHAASAQNPILLIHGKKDRVVGFEQTEEFERALLNAGKTVTAHYPENMGHGYHRWQDRVTRARLLEDFLAEHIGGRSGGRDWSELAAKYF